MMNGTLQGPTFVGVMRPDIRQLAPLYRPDASPHSRAGERRDRNALAKAIPGRIEFHAVYVPVA